MAGKRGLETVMNDLLISGIGFSKNFGRKAEAKYLEDFSIAI